MGRVTAGLVTPLDGVRVIDLADEPGIFATRILADLGADVIRVEPPDGGRVRRLAPFLHDTPGVERSLRHLYHNAGKRSVVCDVAARPDVVWRLAATADALVETSAPGHLASLGLGYEDLAALRPSLVYLSITPYGQDGPLSRRCGTDLTTQASGGLLWVSGHPEDPPNQAGGDQSWKMASLVGAAGVLAALHGREGAHLDVSVQEAVAMTVVQTSNPNHYAWYGRIPKRPGLTAVHRCADGGWVTAHPSRNRIATLLQWCRTSGVTTPETVESLERAADLAARCFPIFRALASTQTSGEFMRQAVERDIWALPAQSLPDLAACEHLRATGQFVEVVHEPLGVTLELPRSPVRAAVPDLKIRRAPLLGEHTDEVLGSLPPETAPRREPRPRPTAARRKPLEGIRVLDFCWVLAGPLGTRVLANLGAEVIRVEAAPDRSFPDLFPPGHSQPDVGAFHNLVDTGKRSITIDPRTERGREVLLRLAERCDVVTDNYRPGALERMGFGYEALRERNPGIVVLHLPGCGSDGPWAQRPTLGNMIVAASGINFLTGFANRAPRGMGVAYADFTSPYVLATCVLAALRRREQTGAGAELHLSQLSAVISLIGVEWLQYRTTGVPPHFRSNRDPNLCPHGVYPTHRPDEWVAIAVDGDARWSALCEALGRSDLVADERFATHEARKRHEDELDKIVGAWTADRDRFEVADLLQARGVAAAAVQDLRDALERDPHLARHYHRIRQPAAPDTDIVVQGEAIRFRGSAWPLVPAPAVGADNGSVLLDVVGLSGAELAELVESRVVL